MIAHSPADAIATLTSLTSAKFKMVYPDTGLPRLSWKKAVKLLCVTDHTLCSGDRNASSLYDVTSRSNPHF